MKPTVGIEPTTYRLIEFAVSIPKLVPPLGIEPSSSVLQTGAMTTSAKAANYLSRPDSHRQYTRYVEPSLPTGTCFLHTTDEKYLVVMERVELSLDTV